MAGQITALAMGTPEINKTRGGLRSPRPSRGIFICLQLSFLFKRLFD